MANFTETRSAFLEDVKSGLRDTLARQSGAGDTLVRLATQLRATKNLDIRGLAETLVEVRRVKKAIGEEANKDDSVVKRLDYLEKTLEEQTKTLSTKLDTVAQLLDKPTPQMQRVLSNTQRIIRTRDGREIAQNTQTGRFERRLPPMTEQRTRPDLVLLRSILDYEKKNYEEGHEARVIEARDRRRDRYLDSRVTGRQNNGNNGNGFGGFGNGGGRGRGNRFNSRAQGGDGGNGPPNRNRLREFLNNRRNQNGGNGSGGGGGLKDLLGNTGLGGLLGGLGGKLLLRGGLGALGTYLGGMENTTGAGGAVGSVAGSFLGPLGALAGGYIGNDVEKSMSEAGRKEIQATLESKMNAQAEAENKSADLGIAGRASRLKNLFTGKTNVLDFLRDKDIEAAPSSVATPGATAATAAALAGKIPSSLDMPMVNPNRTINATSPTPLTVKTPSTPTVNPNQALFAALPGLAVDPRRSEPVGQRTNDTAEADIAAENAATLKALVEAKKELEEQLEDIKQKSPSRRNFRNYKADAIQQQIQGITSQIESVQSGGTLGGNAGGSLGGGGGTTVGGQRIGGYAGSGTRATPVTTIPGVTAAPGQTTGQAQADARQALEQAKMPEYKPGVSATGGEQTAKALPGDLGGAVPSGVTGLPLTGSATQGGYGSATTQAPGNKQVSGMVDYTPSTITDKMGISPEQYTSFKKGVSSIESSKTYDIMGGSSNRFAGRYQMGGDEIRETAARLKEEAPLMTRADGKVVANEAFLKDPKMQERYFENFTQAHHDQLMKESPQYRAMSPEARLETLGYAHNQGAHGAAKYLETGVAGKDGFGTSGNAYNKAVRSELAANTGAVGVKTESPGFSTAGLPDAGVGSAPRASLADAMAGATQGTQAQSQFATVNPNAVTPSAVAGVSAPNVIEKQGQLASVRTMAIKPELKDQLQFAAEKVGLSVEVGSGGQAKIGTPGAARTGSTRHDEGGAADLKLYETNEKGEKRMLDMTNPADAEKMERFTRETVRAGATGVGAGPGYMGNSTLHIGGGSVASWGGAPWIKNALEKGRADTESGSKEFQSWKEKKAAEAAAASAPKQPEATGSTPTPETPAAGTPVAQAPKPPVSTVTMASSPEQSSMFAGQKAPDDIKQRSLGAQMRAYAAASQETPSEMAEVSGPKSLAEMNAMTGLDKGGGDKPTAWRQDPETGKWKAFMGDPNKGYGDPRQSSIVVPDSPTGRGASMFGFGPSGFKNQEVGQTGMSAIQNNGAFSMAQATGESAAPAPYARQPTPDPAPAPAPMPAPAPAAPAPTQTADASATATASKNGGDSETSGKKLDEIEHTINDFGMKSLNTPSYG